MDQSQISKRVQDALDMHAKIYNCAQCVALATCDLVGLDKDEVFRIMEGFGGGMGGFTQTCGALSGGVAMVSQASCNGMEACNSKLKTYGHVKELVENFQGCYGKTLCAELRPSDPAVVVKTCNGYIAKAVELTCEKLQELL